MQRNFQPQATQEIMMSPSWCRAYVKLNTHPKRSVDELIRFYRWAHLVMPKEWLRKYLLYK